MEGASRSKVRGCWCTVLSVIVPIAATGGCSTYVGTTSKSFLAQVKTNTDPNVRYVAYAKLGSPGVYEDKAHKDEAIATLIAKYQEGKEPVAIRAVIIRSLGILGDPRARHVAIKAVNDPEAVIRVEGCRTLGKVGVPEDATILARIMTVDTLEDCRIAAIEGLGWLKSPDPRITRILLDGLDHDDPAIRYECLCALRRITGKDLGVDPGPWRKSLEPTPPATKTSGASTATAIESAPTAKVPSGDRTRLPSVAPQSGN
jgi:HEAT repeats